MISGWRGALGTTAEVGNDDHAGDAVYKGLAIGTADVGKGMATYLYATDFHNGRIDVFDNTFASQTWSGRLRRPEAPEGLCAVRHPEPQGIAVRDVREDAARQRRRARRTAAVGVVDVFLTDGTFLGRVARGGGLNAPWGLAWAPADFGRFSGDLIVGNFGDGKLHAYPQDGGRWHSDGVLRGPRPPGGRGRRPVGDRASAAVTVNNGPTNTMFFAAGPNDEAGGAFGTIDATH